ncbi:MAG: FtsK/SpoIIIE domain-containing protein [Acidimicrobiales bacterium]
MRIVHRTTAGSRVVDIDTDHPDRTVADLLVALDPRVDPTIEPVIDGAPATADSPLSVVALCEGSVVDTTGGPTTTRPPARIVAVVGGIRAGVVVGADGPLTVGRGEGAGLRLDDPALSARHLDIRAGVVVDLGSRNGTALEGHRLIGPTPVCPDAVIRAGTSRFRTGAFVDDQPVSVARGLGARGGTIPFNRPPRVMPGAAAPVVRCPGVAPAPPPREPLSLAGIVLPIVAGAIVAVLFSPFMAVFAALGPVLTIGTWWERRRRSAREHRRSVAAFEAEVAALVDRLPEDRRQEIRRRRRAHPDPAEVVRRAEGASVRLWERRADHPDAFCVAVGVADVSFAPTLAPVDGDGVAAEIIDRVAALALMPDVPLPVDLSPGHVIGLVGDREASVAVARSLLLQMVVHHGPADLSVVVGADDPSRWRWVSWLPHTADHAAGRRGVGVVATDRPEAAVAVLSGAGDRAVLAVLDGDDPFQGRGTVGRLLLESPSTAAIVLVRDEHRLPARCDTVVRTDALGRISVVDPRRADNGRAGLGWGVGEEVAERAARRLARLDDPELPVAGAGVPAEAPLLALLGITGDDPDEIESRWTRLDGSARLAAPIGADGDGTVVLDFVADGPHLLVGGTTGSGKSELLRSMVAGVAATADPDHVAMVLVDYKGGAAFDCCADLPHVAGLVTDLDAELAARAMRCLEAELRYRERRLRAVGADDMDSFRAATASIDDIEPLPRLLVVVDEFASLVADLPDFVEALVGVAQRGRSLGVHLILATQRPAGVVTADIKANAGCRIALRVTDRNDSIDVIDAADAAAIPRSRPGRAVARFGPGELVPFQAAQVTGRSDASVGVRVRGIELPAATSGAGPTDLDRLVAAITTAHQRRGGRRPRSPWPPPLPVDRRRVDERSSHWCVVDDPDEQCQRLGGWVPSDGHLVVAGGPRSGTTTTLAAAALAAVADGTDTHLHVIDLDSGALTGLADLPAAGTVVTPAETVRRRRLLRWLDEEVVRRRAETSDGSSPMLLVVIDDFAGLARAHDVVKEPTIHEQFARVWADGPAVGVAIALSVKRVADLPPAFLATAGTVLAHRTTDPSEGLRLGLKSSTEHFPPGRAVRASDGKLLQVIREPDTIGSSVAGRARGPVPARRPHDVGELGAEITWSDGEPSVSISPTGAALTIAIGDRDLRPATLRLHPGEHALVTGPARSGRTTALVSIARAAGPDLVLVVGEELARRSRLPPTAPERVVDELAGRGSSLVLVDDALDIADADGRLAELVACPPPGVHIVVSVRPDRYRAAYGHWSAEIKSSRAGLLLRPDPLDGDLLGRPLPPRLAVAPLPGRGLIVADGSIEEVQVVLPDDQSAS